MLNKWLWKEELRSKAGRIIEMVMNTIMESIPTVFYCMEKEINNNQELVLIIDRTGIMTHQTPFQR